MTEASTRDSFGFCHIDKETQAEDAKHDRYDLMYTLMRCFQLFLHWVITLDTFDGNKKNYNLMTKTSNYVFFFGGRLRTVTKPHLYSVLVFCALIVPLILFSVFECHYLWHYRPTNWKPAIVLFYYFNLLTISSFLRAACSDSGIVARNIHLSDLRPSHKVPNEYFNHAILPTVHNSTVTMKYCKTCRIWRPPRSSHCPICGVCVLTHDHHCIWLNNCIGQRNYRFFISFLASSSISCILLLIISSFRLSYAQTVRDSPVSLLLLCYCGLGLWYPTILFSYHIFLSGTQQTTHEYLRGIGSKNPIFHRITRNKNNPYMKPSFLENLVRLMFQERGWSLVDPRGTEHYPGDIRFQQFPEARNFETATPL